jgi:Transferase family
MEGPPDAPPTGPQRQKETSTSYSLDTRRIFTTRLFPKSSSSPQEIPLSILDTYTVRFPPASGAWLYGPPADERGQAAFSVDRLQESLQETLNAYPQWAGQLQYAGHKPDGDHKQHRVVLSYGGVSDPGVEFTVAHSPRSIASFIPSDVERRTGMGWDAGKVSLAGLLLPTEVPVQALSDNNKSEFNGPSSVIIQLTTFDCGGVAVAVRIVHCLADARATVNFVNDWARVNRAMTAHAQIPLLAPLFDPVLLDRVAAGDIDADEPDPELIKAADALPIINSRSSIAIGYPISPVSNYMLYFSPKEIQHIWQDASSPDTSITHFDALAAFVWSLMMRNRELDRDEQTVAIPCNIRSRLSPPLPETFLGSPTFIISATGTKSGSLQTLANCIRSSILQFSPSNLSAFLHAKAYENNAQRLPNYPKSVLNNQMFVSYAFSSWLEMGANKVDFGAGIPPCHIEPFVPKNVDGGVIIMEAGDGGDTTPGARWYHGYVGVSLQIKVEVMQSILKDPLLQKYKDLDSAQE